MDRTGGDPLRLEPGLRLREHLRGWTVRGLLSEKPQRQAERAGVRGHRVQVAFEDVQVEPQVGSDAHVNGLPSERARAEESERIVNWAFRQFTMKTLVPGGETVATAPVWLGETSRVNLTTPEGVNVLIPAGAERGVTAEAVFQGPIEAPVRAGQKLGELVVTIPGTAGARLPLLAATDVPRAGVLGRMQGAAMRLGRRAIDAAGG